MSRLSILVVDDDIQFGRLVARVCSNAGHDVVTICNPADIFELYDQHQPDVIFLDIFMPNFDGIEVARWLIGRQFKGKLILMTGHHPHFLNAARVSLEQQIGTNIATLPKPARIEQVLEVIRDGQVRTP